MWLTPLPQHAEGKLVYYGSQALVEANADWHSYDLSPYRDRCGGALMSPANLGHIFWVRVPGRNWYGPCLSVDVAQRSHFYDYVYRVKDIAEVASNIRDLYGFVHGINGEVWVGACPPLDRSQPEPYLPPISWDFAPFERTPSFYPYPPQELPVRCGPVVRLDPGDQQLVRME